MNQVKFSIDEKAVFEIAKDIVSRKNQDGTVVLMRMDDSELFYKIDGIAAEIFSLIDGKKNFRDIAENAFKKYAGNEDRLQKDIDSFFTKLIDMKMISKNS